MIEGSDTLSIRAFVVNKETSGLYAVVNDIDVVVEGNLEETAGKLVDQLGSNQFRERVMAAKELEAYGLGIIPFLNQEAATRTDLETKAQLRRLSEAIRGNAVGPRN